MIIFHKYPQLRPYVGEKYGSFRGPKIYFLGESHYLSKESNIHIESDSWYNGTVDNLSNKERSWTDTRGIIEDFKLNPNHKPYRIFLNSMKIFDQVITCLNDIVRASEYMSYSNFFVRPAYEGNSLDVNKKDIEVANKAFQYNIKLLKPDAVVFMSTLAFSYLDKSDLIGLELLRTPHPSSQWWNRVAKAYGGRKGSQLLEDFLVNLKHRKDMNVRENCH